jgi:pheromone shutdown protein TraB
VVAIEWVKGILVVDHEKTTEEIMNLAGQNMTMGGMIIAAGAHHGITTVGHNSTKRPPAVEDTATGHNIITTMKKGTTIHPMLLITVAVLLVNMTVRGITTTTGHLKSTPRNLCRRSPMMIMAEFRVPRILK